MTKTKEIAKLENLVTEIQQIGKTNAKAEKFLEDAEILKAILNIGNTALRTDLVENLKMVQIKSAIRDAEQLITIIQ